MDRGLVAMGKIRRSLIRFNASIWMKMYKQPLPPLTQIPQKIHHYYERTIMGAQAEARESC